ncbi:hypothetical protein OJ997_01875 [Solirubrobacter phytolaccae]|uniref:Uncharacterized protein n=1 Tax=Solirubrobacter phytolaccae TaxID=1404360 RepID=A0A9X3SCT0_9ACTN|nr:hypothetical protein [Solirubrobacter phytolaccae]MDA0179027.1 hypothetical protein [Solirubrobacter phytolaccae]
MNDTNSSSGYKLTLVGDGITVERDLDGETAMNVMSILFGGKAPEIAQPSSTGSTSKPKAPARRRARTTGESDDGKPKKKRRSGLPGVVKDLSMRPAGKKSFADFIEEKKPSTHQQKQAAILYWLKHEAGLDSGVTVDHVNTCYLEANWPRPAQIPNALSVTAYKKGWIDPSDFDDIKLTTRGEDMVQHDLPPQPKKK